MLSVLNRLLQVVGLSFLLIWASETSLRAYGAIPTPPVAPAVRALQDFIVQKFKRSEEEAAEIVLAAFRYGGVKFPTPVDILAVVGVESSFQSDAIHRIGPSVGLMQINAKAHKEDPENLLDVQENIRKGVEILTQYSRGRREEATLLAYNAGPANVSCTACSSPYISKVKKLKRELQKALAQSPKEVPWAP